MSIVEPNRFEPGASMLLAGLRRRHEFVLAEQGMAQQWRDFLALGEFTGRIGSELYGVICGADSTSIEYMCGAQVASFADLPSGMGRIRVPAQRYAIFTFGGRTATLQATWQQIFKWLTSSDYESAHLPDFEVYAPHANPLAPDDGIEVWVGVVPDRLRNA